MKSIKVKIDVDRSSIKSITDEINKIAKNTKINIIFIRALNTSFILSPTIILT